STGGRDASIESCTSAAPVYCHRDTVMRPCLLSAEPLEDRLTPAAAGVLDPSFGSGGEVIALNNTFSRGQAVAVDQLGRVVVAGYTAGAGGNDFAVLRFNPDGTPDTTFGTSGVETLD